MKQLWAPWRMKFIREFRNYDGGCPFCEIAQSNDDRGSLVLFRGNYNYVLMNKYPYNNGHLMVIPFLHTSSLLGIVSDAHAEMIQIASHSMRILEKSFEAEGFNCGFNFGRVAGAGIVDHLHFHVVPRWNGDNNFLPVLGETRSMPEYLMDTYDRLIEDFSNINIGG